MKRRLLIIFMLLASLFAACAPVPPTTVPVTDTPGPTTTAAVATTQALPPPTNTVAPSPTATEAVQFGTQFIAYVRDGQLLVSDISVPGQVGTTQYTLPGQGDQAYDLSWSPSGEFVAYSAPVQGDAHIFYIFAQGQSSPTDLGLGNSPSWSPDSKSLAYIRGPYPDDNIWLTDIENPSPRQLSFESNHAWGRPVFMPDASALVVSTVSRNDMGAQGNTNFTLESLALDGSGTHAPLPGASQLVGVRLPYDLRFSPDGARLAFSSSFHLSACASPGYYYTSQPDGSSMRQFQSPSMTDALSAAPERYFVGLDYNWMATSDALIANGIVTDCNLNSPTMGQVVAGPQMSILGLDGSEGLIIPGMFHSLSVDRTGRWVAAAHYQDIEDLKPNVEVYSLETGQLVMSLGPGNGPELQP